jgi:hypothetical protein
VDGSREAIPEIGGDLNVKFKVYAIQGVEFTTLEIEARSKGKAIAAYNRRWRTHDGEVESIDYVDDKVEYVVEPVPET